MPPEKRDEKRKRPFHRPRKKGTRSTRPGEHVPVLLAECLAALRLRPGQVVADCTLGFAGHAVELLRAVGPTGHLIACDHDPTHLTQAADKLRAVGSNFTLHHGNFAALPGVAAAAGFSHLDAILADLGMSSMQVDDRTRGFSFLRDGPLDMRMDPTRGRTAAELLNTLSETDLATAFTELGDEPRAVEIAQAIVAHRAETPFARTHELSAVVEQAAPVTPVHGPGLFPAFKQKLLPKTRVFQALRILVNRELASLSGLLRAAPDLLAPGGTVAILSFHSGEDRLVKTAFRDPVYTETSPEPVRPTEEERQNNPRSRSAKLRWARLTG